MMDFAKTKVALRYWLQGKEYFSAIRALDFARSYHQGMRKDGVTPEFAHQVSIASHVRTFDGLLLFPEETIITALLHDVREDYEVSDEEIRSLFGEKVASSVDALTKEFRGKKRPSIEVFAAIGNDPIASVVKLADRIHNQDSMVGVFGVAKMLEYVQETNEYFWPMLKRARRVWCEQEPIYEALGLVLDTQVSFAEALARALRT
jgi:(p)ppGpp synthase/HD superfamily hydrolase